MSYTINEERKYQHASNAIYQAVVGAVAGLEGQMLRQSGDNGQIEARFDKKILGKVLGDRTEMKIEIKAGSPGECVVALEAYPIDPVGRKLMFGARKGVTRTVTDWFFAHLEHRLATQADTGL